MSSSLKPPLVPTGLAERIQSAIDRVTSGQSQMRVPAEASDPDLVLAECRDLVRLLATMSTLQDDLMSYLHLACETISALKRLAFVAKTGVGTPGPDDELLDAIRQAGVALSMAEEMEIKKKLMVGAAIDFDPYFMITVVDLAFVGSKLMHRIAEIVPNYSWNECPTEIVGDLIHKATVQAAGVRNKALEDAARAVEQHDKTDRGWINGSLWDTLTREASARIRALGVIAPAPAVDAMEGKS